jgi:hypothetical protein
VVGDERNGSCSPRGADGSSAEARYSFIYIFEDGQWKISHHHSSLLPESAA